MDIAMKLDPQNLRVESFETHGDEDEILLTTNDPTPATWSPPPRPGSGHVRPR